MPLIYYWRGDNYRRDLDYGAGYHLNQNNPLLHEIDIGDSLWAFTRTKIKRYVLAAELVVRAKTRNPTNYRYGSYRIWGDLNKSRYFASEDQPSVEQVIRNLSIRPSAKSLGHSFQGKAAVRKISAGDHQLLTMVAKDLPIEPRASILPEDRLEAAVLMGDPEAVKALVKSEPAGLAEKRAAYLYKKAVRRSPRIVEQLKAMYEGQCQVCQWSPRSSYSTDICEGHHIRWLSRGGEDEIENLVLLCPNHHRAAHACDAVFDYESCSFDFGERSEELSLNEHLR
jgi:5-methylcytosine-specific restriction protein A